MNTVINKDMALAEGSIQDTTYTEGNPKGEPVLSLRYSFMISLYTTTATMTGSQSCGYIFIAGSTESEQNISDG